MNKFFPSAVIATTFFIASGNFVFAKDAKIEETTLLRVQNSKMLARLPSIGVQTSSAKDLGDLEISLETRKVQSINKALTFMLKIENVSDKEVIMLNPLRELTIITDNGEAIAESRRPFYSVSHLFSGGEDKLSTPFDILDLKINNEDIDKKKRNARTITLPPKGHFFLTGRLSEVWTKEQRFLPDSFAAPPGKEKEVAVPLKPPIPSKLIPYKAGIYKVAVKFMAYTPTGILIFGENQDHKVEYLTVELIDDEVAKNTAPQKER